MPRVIILSILLLSLQTAVAEETVMNGAELTQQHCTRCHGDEVYMRDNRKVKTLESLKQQAYGCNSMTGANLFEEDVEKIINHLNAEFYHFER